MAFTNVHKITSTCHVSRNVVRHVLMLETKQKEKNRVWYSIYYNGIYTRQNKKRNTYNLSTVRKTTSDGPVSFISMQRYVKYCCITYRFQPGVKNVYKKNGHKPSRGQIVKSQKISVFIMLSCWISSSYGNLLSRPNGTQTLILFKFYL